MNVLLKSIGHKLEKHKLTRISTKSSIQNSEAREKFYGHTPLNLKDFLPDENNSRTCGPRRASSAPC